MKKTYEIKREQFDTALHGLLDEAYRRGLEDGLRTAEKIAGYLTSQPQTHRLKELHDWALRDLENARKKESETHEKARQP